MSQHRTLDWGDDLPPSFLDQIQEFVSTMASANFAITQASSTAIQVVAGTGNDQVSVGIMGRWRYITSTISRSHPGGASGVYDVYVVSTDNVFTPTGGSPPETDDTVYAFALRIVASGATPSGSGAEAIYRKVATVVWSGTAITGVSQLIGSVPVTVSRGEMMIVG